jgi:hypothetical protein
MSIEMFISISLQELRALEYSRSSPFIFAAADPNSNRPGVTSLDNAQPLPTVTFKSFWNDYRTSSPYETPEDTKKETMFAPRASASTDQ